ncbi:MAG: antirestriction protein ArdA [Hyphomicrobiales bacterium]|nr:antirestriction protein ArdA [Hyphomicrobiales bacterium]
MSTILYAQPYDISAEGFYFRSGDEYDRQAAELKNEYGQPVEEFEIEFIDGELIDCELAKAIGINQVNFKRFYELVDEWEDHEKTRFIIAVGECGYSFDIENDNIDQLDVDIYEEDNLKDLAYRFVEDGLFGEVPKAFEYYIDYDAIGRDLSADYSETTIAGQRLIYRCG